MLHRQDRVGDEDAHGRRVQAEPTVKSHPHQLEPELVLPHVVVAINHIRALEETRDQSAGEMSGACNNASCSVRTSTWFFKSSFVGFAVAMFGFSFWWYLIFFGVRLWSVRWSVR